ncbi:hypothetical protein EUGRSUZ_D01532 [Eucalyptus grandis]|uniref:Uncharacterized protein n=2 Tax=Eucalyptus grandis TaxID=71139 RepID=A0ACC3L5Y5_EUCGR|nr:hypothetical protein EUGRSUZ_D01532 [Eucalyptus grandis]
MCSGEGRETARMHPEVYKAAKLGDFRSLMQIISRNGEDLFQQTIPKKNNILHVAAQHKQKHFIECLLQHPSGPSLLWEGNYKKDFPLHTAAKVGSCETVRVFIDLAKSLDWVVEDGQVDKSLDCVVEDGQVDACIELLQKSNRHEDTALHYAIRKGHDGVVKLLIEEVPQLCNITNSSDESPLYLAAHRRLSNTIKLILDACPLSSSHKGHKGPKGLTALHAAVHYSLPDWWEILEKRPQVIREADDMGWTPLHYAACFDNVKAIRLLLRSDPSRAYELDPSVAYHLDNEGQSALHIAAFRGHINVINELVRSCPNACDIINNKGQTALHAAVIGGQKKVVEHILRMPTLEDLLNEEDTNKNTALHLAVLHRRYRIAIILARDKKVDRRNTTNRENSSLPIRSIVDSQLLVAALIATVTFAAAFTMPGGYNSDGPNQGMATLASRAAFQAFVIFNTIAFIFSTTALFLQYGASFLSDRLKVTSVHIAGAHIYIAMLGMVLAFASGTYVVLTRTNGLGIVPFVGIGALGTWNFICSRSQPDLYYGVLRLQTTRTLNKSRRYYGIR